MLATATMTAERKLQRVKVTLLRNPKLAVLSGILMVGKVFVSETTPTARTNGRDEWYGRKFVDILDEKQLAFVMVHECFHKMYRHLTTWKKLYDENPKLANMACDYVINLQIRDLDPGERFMAMPRDTSGKVMGLIDERFRGMNAKQVFDILKQEDGEGGSGGGFDEHDWEDADNLTEEEKKDLEREVDQAIRQGLINEQKVNGNGAGGLARELGELTKPKIDWREVLREFVKSVCAGKDNSSWSRVSRRYLGLDIYMPTMISERVGHVVIAVDTSGSIGGRELNTFLTEVSAVVDMVKPECVDLLYWDSAVAGHETYNATNAQDLVQSTKPAGGGGTSPSCITAYMKDKKLEPECVIVLTDGYVGSDWGGSWPCPVLWCIVGGSSIVSPIGKTVHVEDWE